MSVIGNFLWFIFGGFFMGASWWLLGVLALFTIVGIPWARACFVMGKFAFLPFGKEAVKRDVLSKKDDVGTSFLGILGNIIWFVFAGIWLALGHVVVAVPYFISIIGIPFGVQHLKLAGIAISPIGKTIVTKEVAAMARADNAATTLEKIRSDSVVDSHVTSNFKPPSHAAKIVGAIVVGIFLAWGAAASGVLEDAIFALKMVRAARVATEEVTASTRHTNDYAAAQNGRAAAAVVQQHQIEIQHAQLAAVEATDAARKQTASPYELKVRTELPSIAAQDAVGPTDRLLDEHGFFFNGVKSDLPTVIETPTQTWEELGVTNVEKGGHLKFAFGDANSAWIGYREVGSTKTTVMRVVADCHLKTIHQVGAEAIEINDDGTIDGIVAKEWALNYTKAKPGFANLGVKLCGR